MDSNSLRKILKSLKDGKLSLSEATDRLKHLPYENLGMARIDHHRELRHGIPEVIYASGKRAADIKAIATSLIQKSGKLMITKADQSVFRHVSALCRKKGVKAVLHERSGMITAGGAKRKTGLVAVICAGTSDLPIAEEAVVTAEFLGSKVESVVDAGVAGLHRLIGSRDLLSEANVLVVVAGMEGALPSVIGGMTDRPIIAVPTSVGYGSSLGGFTALFAMLNSCVPGIAVMNIDNGFGAGVLAHKINLMKVRGK
jgi:NCAIR mutase (PurE)-related protein